MGEVTPNQQYLKVPGNYGHSGAKKALYVHLLDNRQKFVSCEFCHGCISADAIIQCYERKKIKFSVKYEPYYERVTHYYSRGKRMIVYPAGTSNDGTHLMNFTCTHCMEQIHHDWNDE
mmetsp:Transcript_29790/g.36506  ORF Transcript_29790/g.36506 Transcript_29790/m.36506 type:complete len:118 (-) Transcript_29790:57-410(-)